MAGCSPICTDRIVKVKYTVGKKFKTAFRIVFNDQLPVLRMKNICLWIHFKKRFNKYFTA